MKFLIRWFDLYFNAFSFSKSSADFLFYYLFYLWTTLIQHQTGSSPPAIHHPIALHNPPTSAVIHQYDVHQDVVRCNPQHQELRHSVLVSNNSAIAAAPFAAFSRLEQTEKPLPSLQQLEQVVTKWVKDFCAFYFLNQLNIRSWSQFHLSVNEFHFKVYRIIVSIQQIYGGRRSNNNPTNFR